MAEFNSRDLIEAIYDVRDRVTRIEEQLTNRTEQIQKRSDEAYLKADNAEILATANRGRVEALEQRINNLMVNVRWAWGIAIPSVLTVLGLIVTKFF